MHHEARVQPQGLRGDTPYLTVEQIQAKDGPIEIQTFWWGDPVHFDVIGAVAGIPGNWEGRPGFPTVRQILNSLDRGEDPYKELLPEVNK